MIKQIISIIISGLLCFSSVQAGRTSSEKLNEYLSANKEGSRTLIVGCGIFGAEKRPGWEIEPGHNHGKIHPFFMDKEKIAGPHVIADFIQPYLDPQVNSPLHTIRLMYKAFDMVYAECLTYKNVGNPAFYLSGNYFTRKGGTFAFDGYPEVEPKTVRDFLLRAGFVNIRVMGNHLGDKLEGVAYVDPDQDGKWMNPYNGREITVFPLWQAEKAIGIMKTRMIDSMGAITCSETWGKL